MTEPTTPTTVIAEEDEEVFTMSRWGMVVLGIAGVLFTAVFVGWLVLMQNDPQGPNPPSATGETTTTAAGGETVVGDAANGESVYLGTCATCHGPDAMGIEGLGKSLVDSEFVQSMTDAGLIAFIKEGRDPSHPDNTTGIAMPPKGGNPSLTDQDLADVVAFLRTLQ